MNQYLGKKIVHRNAVGLRTFSWKSSHVERMQEEYFEHNYRDGIEKVEICDSSCQKCPYDLKTMCCLSVLAVPILLLLMFCIKK